MQQDICVQGQNFQELYYQNTLNELLAKGQKTAMELTHVVAANSNIKTNVINQSNILTEQIKHLQLNYNIYNNKIMNY
jgi:hypothetical protein